MANFVLSAGHRKECMNGVRSIIYFEGLINIAEESFFPRVLKHYILSLLMYISVISFYLFILLMGFLQQEYANGLPFLPPMDHVLSELSTRTRLSWVALQGLAHHFIELHKPLSHNKVVIHGFQNVKYFINTYINKT